MTALEMKLAVAGAILLALVVMLSAYSWHEREVGAAALQRSVEAATAHAMAKAAAQTVQLQAKAELAAQETKNAQKQMADYLDAHPIGPVRVCHAVSDSGASLPPATPVAGAPAHPAAPPDSLPAVPAIAVGADIGPGLSLIVRACQQLAVDEAEYQRR